MDKLGVLMLLLAMTAMAGESWAATASGQTHGFMEKEPHNGRNIINNNQDKAIELLVIDRDDDHSNLDLDKLMNDAYRYEILPAPGNSWTPSEGDAYSLSRLFSKMMNRNRMNDFVGGRSQVKRSNLKAREDKDYSFVGQPMATSGFMGRTYGGYEPAASKWAAQKLLRDMILSNRPSYGNEQLRPFSSAIYNGYDGGANELMPTNREKRRRCRADPNLGVKNPSFCDTDAYFGAADYSMRDVWDSAGR